LLLSWLWRSSFKAAAAGKGIGSSNSS
jgi:hypothetical protein